MLGFLLSLLLLYLADLNNQGSCEYPDSTRHLSYMGLESVAWPPQSQFSHNSAQSQNISKLNLDFIIKDQICKKATGESIDYLDVNENYQN